MNNPARGNDGRIVWIAGAVVVAILAVVAVVAVSSSDGDDSQEITLSQTGDVAIGDVTTTEPAVDVDQTDVDQTDGDQADATTTTTTTPIDPSVVPLPEFDADVDDPAVGMTIPKVAGTNLLTGEPMTIEPDGTAKVILFVAHWCPHCRNEVPRIVEHLQDNPMPDGVELVAVSTAVDETAPNFPPGRWLESEGWTAPTLADTDTRVVAAYFGLSSFPFFVAADADGVVVARAAGELTTSQFDQLVAAVTP